MWHLQNVLPTSGRLFCKDLLTTVRIKSLRSRVLEQFGFPIFAGRTSLQYHRALGGGRLYVVAILAAGLLKSNPTCKENQENQPY